MNALAVTTVVGGYSIQTKGTKQISFSFNYLPQLISNIKNMDTTLYCNKCKKDNIDEGDTAPDGDIAENIVHLDCGGLVEEVCAYCLGEGTVVVDEPVYANEPWITAPIGERECICRKQARADRDADDAWKERE